jgi:hypothetical protein
LGQRTKAELLLVTVTMVWGCTFVVVKEALSLASPLPFLAARFTLAGLLLALVLRRGRMDLGALSAGAILGFFLFVGYLFQTWGLVYTTPSKSAFITGFGVVLVPFIQVFYGFHLRSATVLGAMLGFAGIYFLVLPSGLESVNRGDVLTVAGATSFAVHIVLVGGYTRRHSFRHLVPTRAHGADLRIGTRVCGSDLVAGARRASGRQSPAGFGADSGGDGGFRTLGRHGASARRGMTQGLRLTSRRAIRLYSMARHDEANALRAPRIRLRKYGCIIKD